MPVPYSIDLRQKIVDAWKAGNILKTELSRRFNVSRSFVYELLKRYQQDNTIEPRPHKRGVDPAIQEKHYAFIENLFTENPDITLSEACDHFEKKFTKVSPSTMCRALKKFGLTRKKNFLRPEKRPDENSRL